MAEDDAYKLEPFKFAIPSKPKSEEDVETSPKPTKRKFPTQKDSEPASCPLSVGFAGLHRVHSSADLDSFAVRFLLKQGESIVNRLGPTWFHDPVELGDGGNPISLVLGNGATERFHVTSIRTNDLVRGTGPWHIGLSVDTKLQFYMHSRSADDASDFGQELPLGTLEFGA